MSVPNAAPVTNPASEQEPRRPRPRNAYAAPAWAAEQRVGDVGTKAVLLLLANYADENFSCYPGQETIAEETEQSVRTVRRQIEKLERLQLIRREARYTRRGKRTSDRYHLNLDVTVCVSKPPRGSATREDELADNVAGSDSSDVEPVDNSPTTGQMGASLPDTSDRGTPRERTPREQKPLPAVGEVQHRKAIAPSGLRPGNEDHAAEPDAVVRAGDIRAVYASLPDQVRARIGVEASPAVVDAIRAELATGTRTAAQLVDRVARRWDGWQRLGEQLRDPVGLAVTLVRRRQCADVWCEDGRHLETGRECAACARSRPGRVRPEPVEVPGPRPRPDDRRVAEVLAPVPYVPEPGDLVPARPVTPHGPSGPPPGVVEATRARLHALRGVHRRPPGSVRELAGVRA